MSCRVQVGPVLFSVRVVPFLIRRKPPNWIRVAVPFFVSCWYGIPFLVRRNPPTSTRVAVRFSFRAVPFLVRRKSPTSIRAAARAPGSCPPRSASTRCRSDLDPEADFGSSRVARTRPDGQTRYGTEHKKQTYGHGFTFSCNVDFTLSSSHLLLRFSRMPASSESSLPNAATMQRKRRGNTGKKAPPD